MGRGPARLVPEGHKWCPGCQAFLLKDLFSISRSKKDGLKTHCKGCDSKINRKFYTSCPEQGIDRQYKHNYGIDGDVYRELLEKQQGKCAACGGKEQGTFNGKVKRLAVDHCHQTGK